MFYRVPNINLRLFYGVVIGLASKSLVMEFPSGDRGLQRSFDMAILTLLLGPASERGRALKKIQDLLEFASASNS